jgi:hypothetical protein
MSKKGKRSNSKKQRKWKMGLKAGCLALGMATAWGGEARSDVIMHVESNVNRTIYDAYVCYGIGQNSTAKVQSLGTLTSGFIDQKYTLPGEVSDYTGYYDGNFVFTGLFDDQGREGAAVSFPDTGVIDAHSDWVFGTYYTEPVLIDNIHKRSTGDTSEWLGWNLIEMRYARECGTPFGQTAHVACFSQATDGGAVKISIEAVPEPAAWVLLVGAAGAMLFWRRDLLRR